MMRSIKIVEWSEEDQCFIGRVPGLALGGKRYSGKFNLRCGEELHEKLAIESMKVSESLNSYCVKVLKHDVES